LAGIGQAAASAGDHDLATAFFERARLLAREVEATPSERVRIEARKVWSDTRSFDHDALPSIEGFSFSAGGNTGRSMEIWITLVDANADNTDIANAEAAAEFINDKADRGRALLRLAHAAGSNGILDHTERILRHIPSVSEYLQMGEEIADIVAKFFDLDMAEDIARSISDPDSKAAMLVRITEIAMRTDDTVRAERIARSIAHPRQRAYALRKLAMDPDPTRRRLAISQVLGSTRWSYLLGKLLKIQPATVTDILNEALTATRIDLLVQGRVARGNLTPGLPQIRA
jgi:hypothetical protein